MSLSANLHFNHADTSKMEMVPLRNNDLEGTWTLDLEADGGRVVAFLTVAQMHEIYFTIGDAVLRYHEGKKTLEINV